MRPDTSTEGCDEIRDVRFVITGIHQVTVTIEPVAHRGRPQICVGSLLDLSREGARFQLPMDVPVSQTLRVKFAIADLGMEFYVGASVCWTKRAEPGHWQLGCLLSPSIPAGLFERLSRNGRIDRRETDRAQRTLSVPLYWELAGQRVDGVLQNYSRGGLCLLVDRPGRPGQRLQLQLEAEATLVVVAQSEWQIKNEEGYFVGCSFVNSRGFERLDGFCRSIELSRLG